MNIDVKDITLDDILSGFNNQQSSFDPNQIELDYKKRYVTELANYRFVSPYDLYKLIKPGTVIRYIKKDSKLSCVSLVTHVFQSQVNSLNLVKNSGYFVLTLLSKQTKHWKICPVNHYVFYHDPNIKNGIFMNNLREKYDTQNKKYKIVNIDKKTEYKIMKHVGMSAKQIESDKKADELLKIKTKAPKYSEHRVTADNVNVIADEILRYNNKSKK
jgi:hypothetical protein